MAKKRSDHLKLLTPPKKGRPTHEVGYGKPPMHTRFQAGRSGNLGGRPRGAKNKANHIPALNEERMKTVILEEAYRMIGVRDGDRLIEIPVIQAILRSIALNAAKGHQRSQHLFAELVQWVERENRVLYDKWLNTAIDYKTEWERELARRKKYGTSGPEPLPHPDDIVINLQSGEVEIHGPMTKEEKVLWDRLRQSKADCDKWIAKLEKFTAKNPHDKTVLDELSNQRCLRAKIARIIPD